MIGALVTALLKLLTPDLVKSGLDKLLDVIEDAVEKSPNKVDDAIVLPLCKKLREILNISE